MKFSYKTPEECGVPSSAIKEYLQILEDNGLSTHDIIIARGNDIMFEKYYSPFDSTSLHREYSVTKSFVALAVGFAEQDGLLSLTDSIKKYYPEECAANPDSMMGEQTIKNMLMMSTPKKPAPPGWFERRGADRVRDYFENTATAAPLGSRFEYDSSGSFVLCALVEKLTGMALMDYLRQKLLSRIGFSEDARILKCPGGYSWGDSAMLARPADLMRTVRFLLDDGCVDGEQILNREFVLAAKSKLIGNGNCTGCDTYGYGYLIWRTHQNSFFFNGMGCQLAVGCPDKDMIFVINGNNQGNENAKNIILGGFFDTVYAAAGEPLPPAEQDFAALGEYADSLVLWAERGEKSSPVSSLIDGKTFVLEENPMGIKYIRLSFGESHGVLEYANAQGEKSMVFGLCRNIFGVFPEEGYSREVGSVPCHGNYYKCAASAAWKSNGELWLTAQITDEYLGRCVMKFKFEDNAVRLNMRKAAEDFLWTYSGDATGHIE